MGISDFGAGGLRGQSPPDKVRIAPLGNAMDANVWTHLNRLLDEALDLTPRRAHELALLARP